MNPHANGPEDIRVKPEQMDAVIDRARNTVRNSAPWRALKCIPCAGANGQHYCSPVPLVDTASGWAICRECRKNIEPKTHRRAAAPEHLHPYNINTANIDSHNKDAYVAAREFPFAGRQNAYICGPNGTGKTHLGRALLASAAYRGFGVREVRCMDIAEYADAQSERFAQLSGVSVLLMDDFDKLPNQYYGNSILTPLFDLLDRRYERKLQTIITSNIPAKDDRYGLRQHLDKLACGNDTLPGSIISRILPCKVIVIKGPDRRDVG